ncbi:Thymidylate kinase [Psilocybe cubensis]|uniref:Thymidylate kinase n=2 Tax=Psilocybe cubensis TaxID=181762 RepID=A0A8H7XSP0_PSICU|nr:Thymidylate kinase [Psilocybe cubensis]KAH9479825.1 Thymidylate kinase [Psilocybe cubensis]
MASLNSNRRAPFIVIEGLDRSGKTTQTSKLHSRLQQNGIEASLLKFPDRTTAIGQMIDSYLRSASELDDRAIHLLFSANRWELATTIEKLLLAGTPVICDRYAFSGIAFSASKVDSLGDPLLAFEWCRSPDVGLPAPDIVLFFDITPEKAKERGGYGDERYEKEEMQLRVRKAFHRIGEEMAESGTGTRWVSIDAGREREEVELDVWAVVDPLVRRGVMGPINKLWST